MKGNLLFHASFSFCCGISWFKQVKMAFEPAGKIRFHFWPQKASELLHELNVPLGNLIRSFLSWLPKQNEKLGAWQKSTGLEQGRQELGEGKAQKTCVCCFLHYCCIRGVNLPREFGMQRCWIPIQRAHHIYKSSGETSQQDSDVITTRKCVLKKMGPWLNVCTRGSLSRKLHLLLS